QTLYPHFTFTPRGGGKISFPVGGKLGVQLTARRGGFYINDRTPRTRLRIRPEIAKGGRKGDVFLPDALMAKLRRFWAHKARRREGLQPGDPLFCSQSRTRISKRRVPFAFRTWQLKA